MRTRKATAQKTPDPVPDQAPVQPVDSSQLTPEELAGRREDWAEIEDCYPLSPMQEGMLFHTLMNPGSGIYLMQQFYAWEGRLDREAFGRAWQRVLLSVQRLGIQVGITPEEASRGR